MVIGLLIGACCADAFTAEAEHWAFQALGRAAPPRVDSDVVIRGAIDRFVLAKLENQGLSLSPEADRRVLIRRLTLDLHGLPPSVEEVEAFARDDSPSPYERLVDRLLASPRHGERWARHWLDVVRFAETHGFEMNQPRDNAWPYRDYVIRSFNDDKPYDKFVTEQLAGDVLGEDVATAFLVGGPWDQVKSPDPKLTMDQRMDELHDMVSTTGSAFLGLTVGCARCHDHKFDPISQRDYYGLQAVFAGVQHGERELPRPDEPGRAAELEALRSELAVVDARLGDLEPLANPGALPGAPAARPSVQPRGNVERFEPVEARYVRFTALATNASEPCIDELEVLTADGARRNVALASLGVKARSSSNYVGSELHKLEHLNDGLHGNSRSWISGEPGRGWVELELAEKVTVDRVIWARDREGRYSDRLATEYRVEIAREPGGPWKTVASSADRAPYGSVSAATPQRVTAASGESGSSSDAQLQRLRDRRAEVENRMARLSARLKVYAGSFTQPGETRVLFRGDPAQPRDPVSPSALAALGDPLALSPNAPERDRRSALARWITGPASVLTARVIVNRLWMHHFGEGIVSTPSDFGANGARPTHPELLDWLARRLIENGWHLKPIHREIVLSSVYRQSSAPTDHGLAVDAQTRLLWRFPPRRLEAEAIHDTVLFASGKLDLTMGGAGFSAFAPNENYVRVYEPKKLFGAQDWRRMIYQTKVRSHQDGTFGAFDCPDGGQVCPKRARSTTPLQALDLLNSNFILDQAAFFSARLQHEAGADPGTQTRRAFWILFNREPSAEELDGAMALTRDHGLVALCRALLNANELLFMP